MYLAGLIDVSLVMFETPFELVFFFHQSTFSEHNVRFAQNAMYVWNTECNIAEIMQFLECS